MTSSDDQTYDTTPRPSMLRAMQATKWTVSGALSELVDNSFGPARGNAKRVVITHDTKARVISVLDNGQGMSAIGRLFQLGSSPLRAPGDIGNYGYGGSFALLWLASRVEIWTLVKGKVQYDTVYWPSVIRGSDFPWVSNRWVPATISNTPAELLDVQHGTFIRLHLAPERTLTPSNIQRDLAATYAPGARRGLELIWTTIGKNGETRSLGDVRTPFTDPARTVSFNLTVAVDNTDLPVSGVVGIVEDLPFEKSVIAIGYGPRVVIRTKECYTSPDRIPSYSGAGITGWLDLGEGWQPYLATTKDAINDGRAWSALMGHVFDKIEPLLQKAETSKFELILEGIASDLERQIGGLGKVRVAGLEKREPRDPDREPRPASDEPATPQENTEHPRRNVDRPTPTDGEGDDAWSAGSSDTTIYIVPLNTQEMERQLFLATEMGNGIQVAIDATHPVIIEAMKQRPVNRMLLTLGVTREIAETIQASDALRKRLLSTDQRRMLKAKAEGNAGKEARMIHRLLLDTVNLGTTSE